MMNFAKTICDYTALKLISCLIPLIFPIIYGQSIKGCYHPGLPVNGNSTPDKVEYIKEEVLTFTCNQSYVLIGEQRIKCLGNNNWSHDLPFCEKNVVFQSTPQYLKQEQNINGTLLQRVMDGDPHTCEKISLEKVLRLTISLQQEHKISQVFVYVKNISLTEEKPNITAIFNNGLPGGNLEATCNLTHEGTEIDMMVFECNVKNDSFSTEIVQVVFQTEKKIDVLLCDITSFSMEGTASVQCDQRKEFDCGRSHCIPFSKVCDGIRNCWDGRDESKAKCERSPSLLLTTAVDIRMQDTETGKERIIVRHGSRATDYLLRAGTLIWINKKTKHICSSSVDKDNSVTDVIVQDVIEPRFVAVDWIYSHVYWIDVGEKTIEVTNLIGNMRKVLISNIEKPSSIALNPLEGWIFWSRCGEKNVIERYAMDGSNWKNIIESDRCLTSVTLDLFQRRIYWIEAWKSIKSNNFDGSEVTISRRVSDTSLYIRHLSVYQNWIYWVDVLGDVTDKTDIRSNKTDIRSNKTELDRFTNKTYFFLLDMKVYHSWKQRPGKNYCGEDNGNCSHFCFPSPRITNQSSGYLCSCPNGFRLDDDEITCISTNKPFTECDISSEFDCGTLHSSRCIPFSQVCDGNKQCHDGKDEFHCDSAKLIYTSYEGVKWIDINSQNEEETIIKDPLGGYHTDYLFNAGIIFWTDLQRGIIKSAPVKYGSPVTNIMDDIVSASDIAVDWIYNHIYWTDYFKGTIEIADLFGYKRIVLIKDINKPRAIALNPLEGWMFWIQFGNPMVIERCGMDGMHRQIIRRNINHVSSLTIDFDERRIYWNDIFADTISSANYDGTDMKLIISLESHFVWLESIAVYKDWIYWIETGGIFKSNKHNATDSFEVIKRVNRTVISIKIFDSSNQQSGTNHCGSNNGNCQHFCLPSPHINSTSPKYKCSSPAIYSLRNDSGYFVAEGCDPPTLPANTNIIPVREIYFHSQHVKISCDEGFTLFGSNVIICQNGRWNDVISFCDKNIFYNQNISIWKKNIQFITHGKNFTDGDPSTCVTENVTSKTTFVINLQGTLFIQNVTITMQFKNRNIMENNLRMILDVAKISSSAKYTFCNSSTKATWTDNRVELICSGIPIAGQLIKITFIPVGHLPVSVQLCDINVFTVNPFIHRNSKVICRIMERSPNCSVNEFIDFTGNQYISYSAQMGYHLKGSSLLKCENGRWNDDPPKCYSDYSPNSTLYQSTSTVIQPDQYKTAFILMWIALAVSLVVFLLYKNNLIRMHQCNCNLFRIGRRNRNVNTIDSMAQLLRNTDETL